MLRPHRATPCVVVRTLFFFKSFPNQALADVIIVIFRYNFLSLKSPMIAPPLQASRGVRLPTSRHLGPLLSKDFPLDFPLFLQKQIRKNRKYVLNQES